jgi:hypothetical protein
LIRNPALDTKQQLHGKAQSELIPQTADFHVVHVVIFANENQVLAAVEGSAQVVDEKKFPFEKIPGEQIKQRRKQQPASSGAGEKHFPFERRWLATSLPTKKFPERAALITHATARSRVFTHNSVMTFFSLEAKSSATSLVIFKQRPNQIKGQTEKPSGNFINF